jgi:glycosyltransferase involved in cell wall biosynthesis
MNDTISVIIPNYNKKEYIQQCINSVIAQTYRPIEVIVIDDCSSDGSIVILEDMERRIPELRVIRQEKNCGVSTARNTGISVASGKYVTFLDSDDYYYNPNKLNNEMTLIKQGAKLAYSKIIRVDNNGKELEKQYLDDSYYLEGNIVADTMIGKNMNSIPRDYIITKDLAVESGGYPEGVNLYEDLLFLIKILSRVEAKCTYDIGTAYRQDTNGLSKHPPANKYRIRWNLCWKNRSIINEKERWTFIVGMILNRVLFEMKTVIKRLIRR